MKKWIFLFAFNLTLSFLFGQDWDGIEVPASPGSGMVWQLQTDVSDDFNYTAGPTNGVDTFNGKWVNWYHNTWTGPVPTVWRRDHIFVKDGNMQVISSRPEGQFRNVNGQQLAVTNLGCATSTRQVQYPVYIEANVKVMKSVIASNVWLLSSDDTQEIDIVEAYGGDRWNNPWFSNKRVHLSHHVFIRQPFTDWQPSDEGSFYTDGTTVWNENYHRFGVYWRDPWHLEYYVDGELVRVRSGKDQIDPVFHTNAVNPGDTQNDTRTGLSKPMDIIINTEDQTWRALQGLTPTDEELANKENNTYNVDWIRIYKPIPGEVGTVTGVSIDPPEIQAFIGDQLNLRANVVPNNARDLSVVWESDNPSVASISSSGEVSCHAEGVAIITATTNENQFTATSKVTVEGERVQANVSLNNTGAILDSVYQVGGELFVSADFHAGSGNTVIDGDLGGVKFWLREIQPGWQVAKDYTASDASSIGQESGTASATISLEGVPPAAEIPSQNWYFLYVTFRNSDNQFLDQGIFPINIERTTDLPKLAKQHQLKVFPNPGIDIVQIESPNRFTNYQVELISSDGQIIKSFKTSARDSNISVDISQLPKGFYLIKLHADLVYTASFIKN